MSTKPSVPKGTRDFMPDQVLKRNYIFKTIEKVFLTYGYQPIETPTMENLSTLTGKYGEEGDRLLFKVLNNGDFLDKVDENLLHAKDSLKLTSQISKRGLRYDLTVPMARFVVQHFNELTLPFKRYQIQQVWRADRPQRGRYQEFYQCDVDVVGSTSLMYEAELINIYLKVFEKLGIHVKVHLNNRKILFGLAEYAHIEDKFMEMTIALDKIDKIGNAGVIKEMQEKGISQDSAHHVLSLIDINSLEELENKIGHLPVGGLGIKEMKNVFGYLGDKNSKLVFDISLARGLNYYTGCILEVKLDKNVYPQYTMGSLGGGGRYDNLTEVFGLKDVSGVGISFGAERIFDVMDELDIFPKEIVDSIKVMILALDEESHRFAFGLAQRFRDHHIATDIYPEPAKIKKQMQYANSRGVPYVCIIGQEELSKKQYILKEMISGQQNEYSEQELFDKLSQFE